LCVVGSFLLEHTPSAPSTPNTKGKRLGQHACVGGVTQAWGRHARVEIGRESALGVFEKANRRIGRYTQARRQTEC